MSRSPRGSRKHKTNRRRQSHRIEQGLIQSESLEDRRLLTVLLADSFEVGEWNGVWAEDGQNDWKRSTQRESDGSYSAEVDGAASNATLSLADPIDLTTYESAELTFSWYIERGFDSGEYIALDFFDGTNWNEVASLNGNVDQEDTWHNETITIDGSYLTSDFQLRFRAKVSSSREDGFVDNVKIEGTAPAIPATSVSDAIATEGDRNLAIVDRFVSDDGVTQSFRNLVLGPDATGDGADDLYVVSSGSDEVLRFDSVSGAFIDVFVTAGAGGIDDPVDLTFGPDDELYVTSRGTNSNPDNNNILRFDGTSGDFIDVFASGLQRAISVDFGDDGNLYVGNRETNTVQAFDGVTKQSLGSFVTDAAGTTGELRQVTFGRDLNNDGLRDLYVANQVTAEIARYDAATGSLLDSIAIPGTYDQLMWIEVGQDGSIYASVRPGTGDARILRLDGGSGAILDEVALGRDGWSTHIGADNILYVGGNGGGPIIDRIAAGSTAAFDVTLASPGVLPVLVDFTTGNGTATSGSDYTAASGTLVFEPGVTSRTIIVSTLDDSNAEADETFTVTLSNPVGTTILDGTGVGTIIDDDPVNQPPLAEFTPLGFLPGQTASNVQGMSADGRFVVGSSNGEAYRWSRSDGMIHLGTFKADDVSHDGSVVVGGDGISNAYRWEDGVLSVVGDLTAIGRTVDDPGGTRMSSVHRVSADGTVMVGNTAGDFKGEADSFRIVGSEIQPIGDLPGGTHNSGARSVSADGSVVVGRGNSANGSEAYRWENDIFTPLGDLPGGAFDSLAWTVSENGEFVVGQSESAAGLEAYLWSSQTGMFGLGHLPGETTDSRARAVSGDGSIVVGIANHGQSPELLDAFIWDQANGMQYLQSVLIADYGLRDVLAGWTLNRAMAISEDGQVISGHGTNPSGVTEAFVVDLAPDPPNEPPVADDDAYAGVEDTVLNVAAPGVLDGDTDAENDPLTAVLAAQATNGVVVLNTDGSFTYTPNADFNGDDSFSYMANDGTSDSNIATVNLTVTPTNDAPVADAQSVTTDEDSAIAVTLTGSDLDLDSLTFNIVGGGTSNGTLTGTAPNLTYAPGADFNGSDIFTFTVNDGSVTSPAAVVSITVTAVNDAPGITSTAITTATEDSLYSYDVDASDIDVGDTLGFSLDSAPSGMTIDSGTGVIQWTPDNSHVGLNPVTVRVQDVLGAFDTQSFSVDVINTNDTPTIVSTPATVGAEGTPYSYDVDATDPDVGDTLTYSLDTPPAGMTIDPNSGLITWAPTAGDAGNRSVTVRVEDAGQLFDTQSYTLSVSQQNYAPAITSTAVTSATEDAAYSYDVDANDANAGDILTFTLSAAPAGMTIDAVSGLIDWTPGNDDVGTHSVIIRVEDVLLATDTQSFDVTVANVNDAPTITSFAVTVATEDQLYSHDVDATDPDVGDTLTYTLVTAPGGMTINSVSGLIEWTPTAADVGDNTVTVRVNDVAAAEDTQSFTITVDAVASGPNLSHGNVASVGNGWQTVTLDKSYTSMVVVATPRYNDGSGPGVVRVSNVTGNRFDVRVDNAGSSAFSGGVHYIIVEEGVYDEPGFKLEAVKYDEAQTSGKTGGWGIDTVGYQQSYVTPVVVGQVMSANDEDFSVFWASSGSRTSAPTAGSLNVGKHVAEDPDTTRATETIGYLVIEATQNGTIEGLPFVAGVGADTVRGVGNGTYQYSYDAMPNSKTAVLSTAGMDGGDGGWAVLLGDNPLPPSSGTISLAVDEDQLRDSERNHTTEQVAYFVIDPPSGDVQDSSAGRHSTENAHRAFVSASQRTAPADLFGGRDTVSRRLTELPANLSTWFGHIKRESGSGLFAKSKTSEVDVTLSSIDAAADVDVDSSDSDFDGWLDILANDLAEMLHG